MAKLADELVESVKRCITIPASQALLNDAAILAIADEETASKVLPMIIAQRQDYLVYRGADIVLQDGVSRYEIPPRAVGRTIRELKMSDSDGNGVRNLALMTIEDEHLFKETGSVHSFYFEADSIVVVPEPNATGSLLQIWYELRLSSLVLSNEAAKVVSIAGNDVTVDAIPSAMIAGVKVDMLKGYSGGWFRKLDATVTVSSGTTLTFGAGVIPTDLQAGDYIALAGETPIMQVPDECFTYIRDLTAARVCEATGDMEGAGIIRNRSAELRKDLSLLLAPRTQGEGIKIVHRNGLLRGQRSRIIRGTII